MGREPRIAKVKITRTVTEIATVVFDRDGNIEEIFEVHEEIDSDNEIVESIIAVIATQANQ